MNDLVLDWTTPRRVKLTVEDFVRLHDGGAFVTYAKTELIDGDVLGVNSQFRPHAFVKSELAFRLRTALAGLSSDLLPLVEATVGIPPHSAPEPDIVITSEARGQGFVPLETVALVVEVAATTLDFDLGKKQELYASAGIAEYWIVDVEGRLSHQLWAPAGSDYREHREIAFGDPIASATIPGLTIDTTGL